MTMLKSGGIAFCAIFCAQSVLAQDAPGVLVSAEWLEEHLDDPSLILLHVGMPTARSGTAFIPGAHFLNYRTTHWSSFMVRRAIFRREPT